MKTLRFSALLFSAVLLTFFVSCSDDDSDDKPVNPATNGSTTGTCSDGVQNQDETGVDCGGVCPPCAIQNTVDFNFDLDSVAQTVALATAFRDTISNPNSLTITAITDATDTLTIFLQKPTLLGWSNGLNLGVLADPDRIALKRGGVEYSTSNSRIGEVLIFTFLEYRKGGRLKGAFSANVEDTNGSLLEITNGDFDITFDN